MIPTSPMRPLAFCALLALAAGCSSTSEGGIHARLGWMPGRLRVVQVPARGPAAQAGLQPGDELVSIDGVPVDLMSLERATQTLRGPVGSQVTLEVRRHGELLRATVKRAPYR